MTGVVYEALQVRQSKSSVAGYDEAAAGRLSWPKLKRDSPEPDKINVEHSAPPPGADPCPERGVSR